MNNKFCLKRIFAFTLAETLIVIGVIGIVSALTLPNLNSSTGEKEKVAKVKKIYQNLTDALGRAEAVYGPYSEWYVNISTTDYKKQAKRMGERITEFMKVSKTCEQVTNSGCFTPGNVKNLNGSNGEQYNNATSAYNFITADGMSVRLSSVNSSQIVVDIDGPNKGSYVLGKDVFLFNISEGFLVPFGNNVSFDSLLNANCASGVGSFAASWIIKYDNADYLKLDSTKKCPNGTTPTEENPSCK